MKEHRTNLPIKFPLDQIVPRSRPVRAIEG